MYSVVDQELVLCVVGGGGWSQKEKKRKERGWGSEEVTEFEKMGLISWKPKGRVGGGRGAFPLDPLYF